MHKKYKAAAKPYPDDCRVLNTDGAFGFPKADDKKHLGFYTTFNLYDLKRHRATRVVEIPFADLHSFIPFGVRRQELDALFDQQSELYDAILDIPAKSLAGLRMKAQAIKVIHADDDPIELGNATDSQLACSVLNDLLAMSPESLLKDMAA